MNLGVKTTCLAALVVAMLGSVGICDPAGAAAPLEVDAVQSARTLPDVIEVVGVVAKRNASTGTFSLIDREEFRKCQSVRCANFLLPVRWSGKLPSIASVIKVKGAIRDTREGKFLFAESVEAAGK
jgi:hypothetical protein